MAKTRESTTDDPMRLAIVRVIESLGRGEVVSYGEVAERAGYPRRHRMVGQVLAAAIDDLPWWRVVYSSGRLPPVNPTLQESKLIDEGVQLKSFRVTRAVRGPFAGDPAG